MSDPRSTPDPERVSENTSARVIWPVADLNRYAGKTRDRQVLFGERVTVLSRDGDHAYVVAEKDGYVGFIASAALGTDATVTHRISAPATQVYAAPDMKSADLLSIYHGSLIAAQSIGEKFAQTALGYIPVQHLKSVDPPEADMTEVASLYLGTPYLWGGNSRAGIDCSGLVQAALIACNIPCPGDSDQQQTQLGHTLPTGAPAQKGDLFFWKGHVAIAADAKTLIHANAHHMAVAYEPIATAIERIQTQGDGPVTAHKRL